MEKSREVAGATKTCQQILRRAEVMVQEYGWIPFKAYGQAHAELLAIWDAYCNMGLITGYTIVMYYQQIAYNRMMK